MCLSYYKIAHPFQQVSIRSFYRPLFTVSRRYAFRRYSGAPLEATLRPRRAWALAAFGGRESRCSPAGTKGDRTPGMVSCPLLTPLTFLWTRLPSDARLNRGLRGLGSGRLSAYMQLSCPEFRLRDLPRITVRGQSVQRGGVLLRKAPLPSRVYPLSTKRPCGPLAFRCTSPMCQRKGR